MMTFPNNFSISRLPRILFGDNRLDELVPLLKQYGAPVLFITGKHSFISTPRWAQLIEQLEQHQLTWLHETISGEPSPQLIDEIVQRHFTTPIKVVVAIGGGSVLDAAKAIAGLLPHGNSVLDHLEGVGNNLPYHGPSTPFIAIPTTAGTGSEATKNAVLSQQGKQGYKKSFRDECLVPEYAIIDPTLLSSCPKALIAADGMDAFTQLLESYVSLKANPMIDALAWSGMEAVKQGFIAAWQGDEADARAGRANMAYAALLSGITLAQVGLGSVHGLASPLGAFFPIPHGVVCGTLVVAATEVNIQALKERAPLHPALNKYADVGRLLSNKKDLNNEDAYTALIKVLEDWSTLFELPKLTTYGIQEHDFPHIVANCRGSSMLTNPVVLTDAEVTQILTKRL